MCVCRLSVWDGLFSVEHKAMYYVYIIPGSDPCGPGTW